MNTSIIGKIKQAPKKPGVYVFYGSAAVTAGQASSPRVFRKQPLYVGKASNLRNRLASYLKIIDHKTNALDKESTDLRLIILKSEIEALIKESQLIKKLKPKYNILWRDDKSYFYVAFTKEKFSRAFVTHESLNPKRYTLNPVLIGPFTDGSALRLVMRLLRRYFQYCTCQQRHLRECLNAQIGKCLGYCCQRGTNIQIHANNANNLRIYRNNIRTIKSVLRGNGKKLLQTLKDEQERGALKNILEHKPFLANRESQSAMPTGKQAKCMIDDSHLAINRVECYDISNLAGKEAIGALTVLVKKDNEWLPDKNSYRKFKIKHASMRDDPKMIGEIITRRLNHSEWAYPDLIIIDGGIAQYKAAKKASPQNQGAVKLPKIISFAKPQKLVFGLKPEYQPTPLANLPIDTQKLIEKAIYQTHRFAIRYHRQFRRKEFLKID